MLFSKLYLATMFMASAFAAPMPNNDNIKSPAYSVGKEKSRCETVPEQVHARVMADAAADKRSDESDAYYTLTFQIDNEGDAEE
ncbi:hypothetical protein F5Y00DRAFT_15643 [Daldinia vernicosa]|uniref:uncharacterized protein n=1 Tax=Daldinia vernicosa TaxID=114800 RepID=UPI0020085233|nr:uncharacterized protein F5Y00DRAFT_15643 [Daldinia vernicosa]KAI0851131.1 hypothetical protein F5Y00DRAFT_15643 [Daldinia vernicosa]